MSLFKSVSGISNYSLSGVMLLSTGQHNHKQESLVLQQYSPLRVTARRNQNTLAFMTSGGQIK